MTTSHLPTPAAAVAASGRLRTLVWSLRIRRVEFLPVWLAVMLVPVLLSAAGPAGAPEPGRLALTLLTVLAVVHVADMVNSLADRDVDAAYKSRLSAAVYGLGVRNVRRQIAATVVAVVLLAAALAVQTGHPDLFVVVLLETVLVAQYSLPPLRFKGRGVWQPAVAVVIIIWVPVGIVLRALDAAPSAPLLAAVAGFGPALIGVVVLNTAEDLPEDRAHGIRTSVAALGPARAMALATAMTAAGGTATVLGLAALGGLTPGLVLLAAAAGAAVRYLAGTWRRMRGLDDAAALARLRPRARLVPLLVAATGWATVAAAAWVAAGS